MGRNSSVDERMRVLRKALADPEEEVRRRAAESLSRVEAKTDLDTYVRMLSSDDRPVRIHAIYLLAELATQAAIGLLRSQMSNPYDDVRAGVIRALGSNSDDYKIPEVREKAVDIVLMGLEDANPSVRVSAADALAKYADPRSEEALLTVVTSRVDAGSEGIQLMVSALLALGKIRSRKAVPVIMERAKTDNLEVREAALRALGLIGDARAEGCLIEALADDNTRVRMQAAESLGKI